LRKKQEELEILKAQIKKMALGGVPSLMSSGKNQTEEINVGKSKKRRRTKNFDLSEMEKENLQVLEAKNNLAQNLKIKKEK
jgi:hypothetical protein